MFIEEFPDMVPVELCERIIARFESDPDRRPSTAYSGTKAGASDVRSGTILVCDFARGWQPLMEEVLPAMNESLKRYVRKHEALGMLVRGEGLTCTIPVIERVDPGQGFNWHFDHSPLGWQRVIAGLIYLRTVDGGGATEFQEQNARVEPRPGKIVLFPPYWTHLHRGAPVERGTKYVMSYFWTYAKYPPGTAPPTSLSGA